MRLSEGNARASERLCHTGEIRYELESFRRTSGSGSDATERVHWEEDAQLFPLDPALDLVPSDGRDVVSLDLLELP